jgi:hypothetical protein
MNQWHKLVQKIGSQKKTYSFVSIDVLSTQAEKNQSVKQ